MSLSYCVSGVLQSTNGSLFRGYLIEGRLADNSSTDPVGTFIDVGPNSHTICGQASNRLIRS